METGINRLTWPCTADEDRFLKYSHLKPTCNVISGPKARAQQRVGVVGVLTMLSPWLYSYRSVISTDFAKNPRSLLTPMKGPVSAPALYPSVPKPRTLRSIPLANTQELTVSFTADRCEQELVAPARTTPHEIKHLSDIDNQRSLRFYQTVIEFFRGRPGDTRDPVAAIRSGLREALVYFYPLAGRLRELPPDGRLIVECTAEGVAFVEADADVTLAELGEPLLPPYPCVDELLCDLGDGKEILAKPLAFLQVTRFRCGGFSVGTHMCHPMHDGSGMRQFLEAIGDMARGEPQPTVLPVWERELLTSRSAPRVTRAHLAYEPLDDDGDAADDVMLTTPPADMAGRYFFLGPAEISAIPKSVPEDWCARPSLRRTTNT
ncbi:hypothetical protein EJB05_57868, partial [Eragrostis curvula]